MRPTLATLATVATEEEPAPPSNIQSLATMLRCLPGGEAIAGACIALIRKELDQARGAAAEEIFAHAESHPV